MSATFEQWMDWVVGDQAGETQWLNILSQLEYVGCRKILKSVPFDRVNADVLQHIQEEALHAHLLKQVVLRREGREGWEAPAWSEAAWEYIQTVDQGVCDLCDASSFYPLVSWVIEQRVLWLYPLYLSKTLDANVQRALKTILAQEKRHAAQFEALAFERTAQVAAVRVEERAWDQFVDRLHAVRLQPNRSGHAAAL